MKISIPSRLSDAELVAEVKRLARCEREATAHLVAHLAELDARRLYLAAGFPSLFTYCCEVLELSEQSTYNRIEVARTAKRFPVILEMLSDAALTLATARLLAPHLTADNHDELLAAASHKSKREVEELLARLFPRPEVPASMRKLRGPTPALRPLSESSQGSLPATIGAGPQRLGPGPPTPVSSAVALPPPSVRRSAVRPLAEDRYEIRFTASASTCEKLKLAQDLLRHAVPTGDTAEIVDRALTALLEDLARKKFAATERPRTGGTPEKRSRHIPADVKRTVWLRDQGGCSFTSAAGRRCGTRGFLEYHHLEPFAVGGPTTAGNIQLRCRAHNAYEADLYFGPRCDRGGEGVDPESAASYGDLPSPSDLPRGKSPLAR